MRIERFTCLKRIFFFSSSICHIIIYSYYYSYHYLIPYKFLYSDFTRKECSFSATRVAFIFCFCHFIVYVLKILTQGIEEQLKRRAWLQHLWYFKKHFCFATDLSRNSISTSLTLSPAQTPAWILQDWDTLPPPKQELPLNPVFSHWT